MKKTDGFPHVTWRFFTKHLSCSINFRRGFYLKVPGRSVRDAGDFSGKATEKNKVFRCAPVGNRTRI